MSPTSFAPRCNPSRRSPRRCFRVMAIGTTPNSIPSPPRRTGPRRSSRLVSFASVEQAQAEPLDLNAILSGLLKFRAPEWKAKGVEIKFQLAVKRAIVLGSPGQIEQVLLNLLVDAEKSAAEARDKVITVSTSLLAKRVLVEISYPLRSPDIRGDSTDGDHTGSGALGLGVCRGIIESHGGEFRVVRTSPAQARFDIELPVIEARQTGSGASELSEAIRQLTVLVADTTNGVFAPQGFVKGYNKSLSS